jgi:predicted aldo/keto reductase-like oxidoreductase
MEVEMEKVRLGRTNLAVKKLGWGGIPIQRVGEEEAVSVVRAVVEMGVDLLDTARSYTTSEHCIGRALQQTNRPVVLSSKTHEESDKSYDDVQLSLKELQVKKIHIYHLHNVFTLESYEKVMSPGGAYEGLQRARKEGWIDHIGLTSHSLEVLEKVLNDNYFPVIMLCYSFLEAEAARLFPLAQARDVGVLAMKPFSGGMIQKAGTALRYVLSAPEIVAIPGSETVAMAKENWKIFAEGNPLSLEDRSYIDEVRKQLDRQFCRRCDYCQPCSSGINIQMVMGMKAFIKRLGNFDRVPWIKNEMEKARNCIECGDCLPRCPYHLPIPELIKENLALYDALNK